MRIAQERKRARRMTVIGLWMLTAGYTIAAFTYDNILAITIALPLWAFMGSLMTIEIFNVKFFPDES